MLNFDTVPEILNLLKIVLLDKKYHEMIDNFYRARIHRHDFLLNGQNKICYYYNGYLVVSIDKIEKIKF